jgi:UDP-N-acetylmuramate--alanine ligase
MKDIYPKYIYFIGIGGIGMSAIARFFLKREVSVAGYDHNESALTKQLSSEGAFIIYEDDTLQIWCEGRYLGGIYSCCTGKSKPISIL